MITEEEARELVVRLNDLKVKSKEDPSTKKDLQKHEKVCVDKLKYLVTMKVGRYKQFSNYEDLLQEGYEALLKGIKTYDPSKGSIFWWLHKYIDTRISRSANLHTAIRYPLKVAREQAPHKEFVIPNIIDEFNCPERNFHNFEIHQLIDHGMNFLSDRQKEIITLAFGLDDSKACSINKISRKTNLSRTNVIKEYRSALNILREHFKN